MIDDQRSRDRAAGLYATTAAELYATAAAELAKLTDGYGYDRIEARLA